MRRKRVAEKLGLGDQFAEWLIRHCPLTTLTLLSLVVIASAVTFERPWIVVSAAVVGDVALSLARRSRHPRVSSSESHRFESRAAA